MHEIPRTIEEEIARKTKAECREQLIELRQMVKVGELRKLSKRTVWQLLAEKRQKAAEYKKAGANSTISNFPTLRFRKRERGENV